MNETIKNNIKEMQYYRGLGMADESASLPERLLDDPKHKSWYLQGRDKQKKLMKQLSELEVMHGISQAMLISNVIDSLYQRSVIKETPAKGVQGILLLIHGSRPVFRVYKHSKEERHAFTDARKAAGQLDQKNPDPERDEMFLYTDYDIHHYDLDITIDEDHASLFETVGGNTYVDYNSEYLGRKGPVT